MFQITNRCKEVVDTRIGTLSFENGYPTAATVTRLFDEMDFERACQTYLWALPLIGFVHWQHSQRVELGAKNGQIVFVESYQDKLGIMTPNTTTPYVLSFIDLAEKGPFVIEMPVGEVRGAAHGQETDWGQIYMGTYKNKHGDWLDGGVNYVLHLPPDVPAETFWSESSISPCRQARPAQSRGQSNRPHFQANPSGRSGRRFAVSF